MIFGSRIIRVDGEVKRLLDEERLPTERNYNGAIIRLIQRADERKRERDERAKAFSSNPHA